jgi:hypothetical protein
MLEDTRAEWEWFPAGSVEKRIFSSLKRIGLKNFEEIRRFLAGG